MKRKAEARASLARAQTALREARGQRTKADMAVRCEPTLPSAVSTALVRLGVGDSFDEASDGRESAHLNAGLHPTVGR